MKLPKWTISLPLGELLSATGLIAREVQRRVPEGAEAVGVSVLANVHEAYRAKSDGNAGSDGITWKELSPRTVEARVRRRTNAKQIVAERQALADYIRNVLYGQDAPRLRNGGKIVSKEAAVTAARRKRADLKRKLDNLVISEAAVAKIGIDTGLQRASAAPGFTDPTGVWSQVASDGQGGNVFLVDGGTVTIGFDRNYSPYFDAVRPLLPTELPSEWHSQAAEVAAEWGQNVIDETIRGLK